jgi:hypothetical protein
MKKLAAALALVAMTLTPAAAIAADAAITTGKMVYTAEGKRVGAIYRLKEDGSAQVIVNGKLVTLPASTLSVVDGKVQTILAKQQILASR